VIHALPPGPSLPAARQGQQPQPHAHIAQPRPHGYPPGYAFKATHEHHPVQQSKPWHLDQRSEALARASAATQPPPRQARPMPTLPPPSSLTQFSHLNQPRPPPPHHYVSPPPPQQQPTSSGAPAAATATTSVDASSSVYSAQSARADHVSHAAQAIHPGPPAAHHVHVDPAAHSRHAAVHGAAHAAAAQAVVASEPMFFLVVDTNQLLHEMPALTLLRREPSITLVVPSVSCAALHTLS
jgi:hypothetical protein